MIIQLWVELNYNLFESFFFKYMEATKIFCKLNSFKYLYRHEEKNGQEDIEKAANYKNKYLELGGTEKEFEEGMNGYELSQYNTQ